MRPWMYPDNEQAGGLMQFESLAEFLSMGGHGPYVWLAYGAAALVFLGNWFAALAARRRIVAALSWSLPQERADQAQPLDRQNASEPTLVAPESSERSMS